MLSALAVTEREGEVDPVGMVVTHGTIVVTDEAQTLEHIFYSFVGVLSLSLTRAAESTVTRAQ